MNDACCSRPLVSSDYEPVGKYETLKDGTKLYTTGSADATKAVVFLYDVFGYTQQVLLGADTLAATLSARVYVPDFFRGQGPPRDTFPVDTDAKRAEADKFLAGVGNFSGTAKSLPGLCEELKAKTPAAKKWAVVGFCWGGKVVALSSLDGSPWQASAACHPGLIEPDEARAFTIPHVCLLSGEDGSEEEQKAYQKALGESGQDVHFEVFADQVHGWMAGRGDLTDEKVKKEFQRGYDILSTFFEKHL